MKQMKPRILCIATIRRFMKVLFTTRLPLPLLTEL